MIYIVLFGAIAVAMVSSFADENFPLNVETNMRSSLKDRYGVRNQDYRKHWDHLQLNSKCCGVTSYTDWFTSTWADEVYATSPSNFSALPLSCRYENLPQGSCMAIEGYPQLVSDSFLLLDQFSRTSFCNTFAQDQGTLDYIYADSCSQLYTSQLREEMRATMVIVIIFAVTDFVIILVLVSVAYKLPFRRRVHVYDIQQT